MKTLRAFLLFLLLVTVGGGTIRASGEIQEPATIRRPAVIFVHGWGGDRTTYDYLAARFERIGYVTVQFDLPGHGRRGENRAELTRKDFLLAVIRAYDELASRSDVDSNRIGVVGVSLGAYLAAILAGERRIEWLNLQAPAHYPDAGFASEPLAQIIEQPANYSRLLLWRASDEAQTGTFPVEALRRTTSRMLLIECERDEVVPPQTINAYYQASRLFTRREVLIGAGHAGLSDAEQRITAHLLLRWLTLPAS